MQVENRSSQTFGDLQMTRSHKEESAEENEESKAVIDMLMKKNKMYLEEDYSCNCSDYCPDPNSSELEVSLKA